MMRTFVAVDFPEDVRKKIVDIQRRFTCPGVRLVAPGLVHITIKFLGNIDEGQVEAISKALQGIQCPRFDAEIKGVGAFPSMDYINVIWVGVDPSASPYFEKLHNAVEEALAPYGVQTDRRKFTAHATIARVKHLLPNQREQLINTIKDLSDVELGRMKVDHIRFKKSTLTPKGPIYETLHEVRL